MAAVGSFYLWVSYVPQNGANIWKLLLDRARNLFGGMVHGALTRCRAIFCRVSVLLIAVLCPWVKGAALVA